MDNKDQTLWDRIIEVAEIMKDVPAWKKGSALNEGSSQEAVRPEPRVASSPSFAGTSLSA